MFTFRKARPGDTDRCYAIETTAYEGEEAATRDKIARRIRTYPDGFLVLGIEGRVVGFINSGCADSVEMSDEAFKELVGHDPDAPNVVILSVVVDPAMQGKGLARALMAAFVARMRDAGKQAIFLMCRDHHVPLYEKFGYAYLGPATSTHGGVAWHEMRLDL